MSLKLFLTPTIILFLFLFCVPLTFVAQVTPQYLNNPNYELEIGKYKIYKTKQVDIVMLGNSLTHGANWNELLGRTSISEQGIPSDISAGVINRMEYIYKVKPTLCFIMIGVNDIFSWIPVDTVFANYKIIVENLKRKNIIPVIQSVLYAGRMQELAEGRNREITKLNKLLVGYSKENNIEYINLNKKMSRSFFLKSPLTYDGIHLTGQGFKIWGREVDKILRKYSL
ncbi:MAG: GDSL-type esterase/lipase family protein [Melioribacteraceae bacterium]|nr:GDSL-type esterase/lipase family protein [Melioribacteraceae bacterium]